MANAKAAIDRLAVLGDATRRRLFEKLAEGPSTVGELARIVPVTRPAVSQHLRVLKEAGLVADTAEGTRRVYRIDPRGIGAIREWIDRHWRESLHQFRELADRDADDAADAACEDKPEA
jgi:DNA-binding transcriptional ArsR family regulator